METLLRSDSYANYNRQIAWFDGRGGGILFSDTLILDVFYYLKKAGFVSPPPHSKSQCALR